MANQPRRHRRSIRLPEYDYRSAGAYFVTICSHERVVIFDEQPVKRAVELAWMSVGRYCRGASVDAFVVMPNHVHAIVWISGNEGVGAQHTPHPESPRRGDNQRVVGSPVRDPCAAPLQRPRVVPGSLAAVLRAFKSNTTKRVNNIRDTPGARVWQRSYYEHIIRNEQDLVRIRQYIIDNPLKWADDSDNPANIRR